MKKQEASDDSLVINKDATGNGSSPGPIASHGLCHRLTEDGHFRNKFLQTVFLCWANIGLGWVCGQHGPSFVDLQIITNVDLEKGAMFITAISAGWLVGSLVSGIVFDFFNKPLLIVVSCLGLVVTVVPIPWCTTYSWMVAINFVSALFKGALCAGLTVFCVTLWRKEGRTYIQALHFAFALGGILSPLALEPYLAPRVQVPSLHAANGSLNNYSEFQVLPSPNFDEKYRNSSAYGIPNTAAFFLTHGNNSGLNSTGKTMMFINGESRIHYAFIMSGTLVLSAAIPFIYFYTKSSTGQKVASEKVNIAEESLEISLVLRIFLISLVSSIIFLDVGIEVGFTSFLSVFCVEQMGWSTSDGSFGTSAFMATFGMGRLLAIFIIRFIDPVKMLFIFLIIFILAFGGIIISALMRTGSFFWVCVACCGFGMSIIFPTVFSWTEEKLFPVTGRTASVLLVSSSLGAMVNPLFLGHMMSVYTTMWFPYILFSESLVCTGLVLVVFAITRCFGNILIGHGTMELEITVNGNGTTREKMMIRGDFTEETIDV